MSVVDMELTDVTEEARKAIRDMIEYVVNEEPIEAVIFYRKNDNTVNIACSEGMDRIATLGALSAMAMDTWNA